MYSLLLANPIFQNVLALTQKNNFRENYPCLKKPFLNFFGTRALMSLVQQRH